MIHLIHTYAMNKLDKLTLIMDLMQEQIERLSKCIIQGKDPTHLKVRDKQIKDLFDEVCQD